MRLLILGGTRFVGRYLVEVALARGHHVTLFNRGLTNPDLFPEVDHLVGDRDGGLGALRGGAWDAVIDTCGYTPGVVRQSTSLLAGATSHYTFISTLSVYGDLAATHGDFSHSGMDETAPTATLHEGESLEEGTLATYGALKALCEREVEAAFPGRAFIVRCGLIVGPHDASDRFTYWPSRVARGGEVLAPGEPEAPVQLIDVRDLADWVVRMLEARRDGTFLATGPGRSLTMRQVLDECKAVTGSDARFTWVDDDFLAREGVQQYVEMPLWVRARPETAGFSTLNISKAVGAGLTFRPLTETIRDTYTWDITRGQGVEPRAGLSPERERQLLQVWHTTTDS